MNKQGIDILNTLLLEPFINQRILAEVSGHSLGVVNRSLKELIKKAKAEFLKGSTPATGSSSNNKKDETKYDAYKKAGNVKGMLNEKLGAYRNKENEE